MLLTRWLFLRLLALVYLVAIVSLWVQIDGLIGSGGILPVSGYLERVEEAAGASAYWRLPTLSWIDASDPSLHALCGIGVLLSLLMLAGVAQLPVMVALWAVYLSLMNDGQTFLSFQWDILLVETGFASLFVAPTHIGPRLPWNERPPFIGGIWLLRVLLFKLMFLSGVVKLLSMDETWWGLTALDVHYYTQPLAVWTSWYAHHLPSWIQQTSVFVMFVIEIGLPFLIFFPRRARFVAFVGLVSLQVLIAATGSYGYFNLLTAVLCVPLLDDDLLRGLLPTRWRSILPAPVHEPVPRRRVVRALIAVPLAFLMLANTLATAREMSRTLRQDSRDNFVGRWLDVAERYPIRWCSPWLLRFTDTFDLVNGYGLFRSMTTKRPEIVLEGSQDGVEWREYTFRWKPGDLGRRPRWAAPHQPRLDWQMWFAALNPRRAMPWIQPLIRGLLEGEPHIVALLESAPFGDTPPRYIRLVYYEYEFTTRAQASETGNWWTRRQLGYLSQPISLETYR